MLVYSVMLLVTLCFAWAYDRAQALPSAMPARRQRAIRVAAFVLACLPAVLVASVRFMVGSDYDDIYWLGYLMSVSYFDDPHLSKSYGVLCRVLNLFSPSPILFFCVSSCLIYVLVFLHIRRTHRRILLPVALFFVSGLYFVSLNAVRQFMAIAVWLCAWPALRRRRLWPYLLITGAAALLHPSALLLLPLYALYGIRLTRKRFLLCGAAVAGGGLLFRPALVMLITILPKYSRYLSDEINPELAGMVFALLLTAAAFALYAPLQNSPHGNFLLWLLLCYDAAVFLSLFLPQMRRVMLYFEIPVFVDLIPVLLACVPAPRRRPATAAAVLFLLCSTCYLYGYLGHAEVLPYQTVFSVDLAPYRDLDSAAKIIMHF